MIKGEGHSRWVHVRRVCPTFLRPTFQELAACSISRSEWARAFYNAKIASGKPYQAAVLALAYKWIRVLFRCWKVGRPYDERTCLQTLAERNSPLKWQDHPASWCAKRSAELRSCPQKILDGVTQMTSSYQEATGC
jgi:hypothetical protein